MCLLFVIHSIFLSRPNKQHVTHISGMLPKNFQVGHQILNNIAKNSFSAFRFSKKISKDDKFVKWSESKIRLTPIQYQKKLKQCPKPSFAQLCCKKLFSKPKFKKVNRELFNLHFFLLDVFKFLSKIISYIVLCTKLLMIYI